MRLAENTGRGSRLGSVTARHSSNGHQPNCGVKQRAPPIFGRAAITLGTGPHSSFHCSQQLSIYSATTLMVFLLLLMLSTHTVIQSAVTETDPSSSLLLVTAGRVGVCLGGGVVWLGVHGRLRDTRLVERHCHHQVRPSHALHVLRGLGAAHPSRRRPLRHCTGASQGLEGSSTPAVRVLCLIHVLVAVARLMYKCIFLNILYTTK